MGLQNIVQSPLCVIYMSLINIAVKILVKIGNKLFIKAFTIGTFGRNFIIRSIILATKLKSTLSEFIIDNIKQLVKDITLLIDLTAHDKRAYAIRPYENIILFPWCRIA